MQPMALFCVRLLQREVANSGLICAPICKVIFRPSGPRYHQECKRLPYTGIRLSVHLGQNNQLRLPTTRGSQSWQYLTVDRLK